MSLCVTDACIFSSSFYTVLDPVSMPTCPVQATIISCLDAYKAFLDGLLPPSLVPCSRLMRKVVLSLYSCLYSHTLPCDFAASFIRRWSLSPYIFSLGWPWDYLVSRMWPKWGHGVLMLGLKKPYHVSALLLRSHRAEIIQPSPNHCRPASPSQLASWLQIHGQAQARSGQPSWPIGLWEAINHILFLTKIMFLSH